MRFTGLALFSCLLIMFQVSGQSITGRDTTFKVITTAVPFLTISPDARQAGLGDAGVASTPDANSAFWNPGKLAFIDKAYGGSLSYTPWLGKIINDMWISYLSGFYKITREQAVGMSMKYFDLGDISFRSS
nr:PorV/PorQ family protein [Cyclobacteriaceae bacterium]